MKLFNAIATVFLIASVVGQGNAQSPIIRNPFQNPSGEFRGPLTKQMLGRSANGPGAIDNTRERHVDSQATRHQNKFDRPNSHFPGGLPTWTGTIDYQGLEFTYRMVGSDPKLSSMTTLVPTEIIPLRFVFPDGAVLDSGADVVDGGETAVQRIVESPIFQNYNFLIGGTLVGNTQFGDAFQRANFWDSVSTRSPNYHVLLGQPTILPTQTVIVPTDKDRSAINPHTGQLLRFVDDDFLWNTQAALIDQLSPSPNSLPIVLWGAVEAEHIAGIHPWQDTINGPVAYIGTSYRPSTNSFFDFGGDIYVLSHEIVEWMDDPFGGYTPGWNFAFDPPSPRCSSSVYDLFEVADPVEFNRESEVPLYTSSLTYHVTDAVFIDFFTRAPRSRSVNGQYDLFNISLADGRHIAGSSDCVGDVHLFPTLIDVPGSLASAAFGTNNQGEVVGGYVDSSGEQHGFLMRGGAFATIDFPGGTLTDLTDINDDGVMIGNFIDTSGLHGFLYDKGSFHQIDFPGSLETVASGINSSGDIVGAYVSSSSQVLGFILHNGQFQTIAAPFGIGTHVGGINDKRELVGFVFTPTDSILGFVGGPRGFTERDMAGALQTFTYGINNSGMKVGFFVDGRFFYTGGFIDLFGNLHEINMSTTLGFFGLGPYGTNESQQVVGYTYDPVTFKLVGFISELPIANRRGN